MKSLIVALIAAGFAWLVKWLYLDYDPTIDWSGPLDGQVRW